MFAKYRLIVQCNMEEFNTVMGVFFPRMAVGSILLGQHNIIWKFFIWLNIGHVDQIIKTNMTATGTN